MKILFSADWHIKLGQKNVPADWQKNRFRQLFSSIAEVYEAEYELPSDTVENGKLNRLRAAVLGANDGIVSVSAVVMGVAGAAVDSKAVAVSGLAALIAGALSMAVGEYVSVSSQSDAEKVYIEREF
jgi:hypothetical protein